MAKFIFRLPSENDIRNSTNGRIMLHIINTDHPEKYTLVTGCPGSGKTTVSIFRLIRLINNDKPAILLTYQRMLKVAIENLLLSQNIARDKASTLHQWFYQKTGMLLGFSNQDNKLSAGEIETALLGTVATVELILDEAQDLEERIFQSFPKVFGRITIGADNDQQMNPREGTDEGTITKHLNHSLNEFILQFNYRNTYQVYNFARHFVPDSPKANDKNTLDALRKFKNEGDLPQVLKFDNQNDMQDRIKAIIQDNKGFNVGILLPFTGKNSYYEASVEKYYSLISEMGFECSKYHNEMTRDELNATENNLQSILITTFISAKGMEFDIVIIPEFQYYGINPAAEAKKYYVGCTRAKNRLVLMYTGSQPAVLNNFPSETYDNGKIF